METVSSPRRSPWVLVPPPPFFVLVFLAGKQLDALLPVGAMPDGLTLVLRLVGIGLIAVAGALIVSAPLLFALRRTTLVPHGRPGQLVTGGPFRLTRNPMYLGLTVAYIGAALVFNLVWPLLLLALPVWVIQARVIPFEERQLTERFGQQFAAYQRRVRRWV